MLFLFLEQYQMCLLDGSDIVIKFLVYCCYIPTSRSKYLSIYMQHSRPAIEYQAEGTAEDQDIFNVKSTPYITPTRQGWVPLLVLKKFKQNKRLKNLEEVFFIFRKVVSFPQTGKNGMT